MALNATPAINDNASAIFFNFIEMSCFIYSGLEKNANGSNIRACG
jgi:hypothetical protein